MSSVLVLIIIPEVNYEKEIREKENARKLKRRNKKNHSSKITNLETIEDEDQKLQQSTVQKSLEEIVKDGLEYLNMPDATWQKSANGNYWQIAFPVDHQDSDIAIQHFKSEGIGLRLNTSIGIIPFSFFCYNEESDELDNDLTYDETIGKNDDSMNDMQKDVKHLRDKEKQSKFLKSITARLTVAQIVNSVRESATITFDFVCYIMFASWIAAMGLLDNSVISLVASMLVSPMMGPVMALTFGTIIKDKSLRNMGLKNILLCLLMTISFGFFFGLIALNFTDRWNVDNNGKSLVNWPTDMMRERGLVRVTWVGTLVAFPSGCAVAISLLSGNDASLVGVAISVSLLPPAVNSGLLWAFSLLKYLYSLSQGAKALVPQDNYTVVYSNNMSIEALYLGLLSLALSLINIINIIIGALLLLKIKEIAPLSTLSPVSRRFFQEDIKIAREYNERNQSGLQSGLICGPEVLREYADVVGIDSKDFLSPESRDIQLQTILNIANGVNNDEIYQTVSRNVNGTDNLARRLSQGIFIHDNNNNDRRHSLYHQQDIVKNDRRPSMIPPSSHQQYGNRGRRVSHVALNHYHGSTENISPKLPTTSPGGITNKAFTYDQHEINLQIPDNGLLGMRRKSSVQIRIPRFDADNNNNNNSQSPPKYSNL